MAESERESDSLETVNALAEAICEAYVGVIQGLRAGEEGAWLAGVRCDG